MKAAFVALVVAGLVSAQNFDGIPECAQTCLRQYLPEAGCEVEDTACSCRESTQARLRTLVAPCFIQNCDAQELIQAQEGGAAACESLSSASSGPSSSAESSASATDEGTTGSATILPIGELPPITPPASSDLPLVTPPAGNSTSTPTSTATESTETGGSGGAGGGSGGDDSETGSGGSGGTSTETDAAPMATAGLVAALLAAAIAI